MLIEKQRSEQEVASLRLFMDEERKEMAEMRRQQQEVLNAEGGEPLSLMYSQLLQNYENVKDEYSLLRKRYDDLAASHSAAVSKLEHSQVRRHRFMYRCSILKSAQILCLHCKCFKGPLSICLLLWSRSQSRKPS